MTPTETNDPAASSSLSFAADQKLAGVYVLRKQVSAGGSGLIWLAYDEVLGKEVSLHFVPAGVRADTRAMNELRHEIKRNRQLIHPNILRVYDLIEEADWVAISMDCFEGESLAVLLKKKDGGFFEPSDVKPWLQQVLQTLEDVHKIQIVHRNVSPANLIVDTSSKLLAVNFGISRVIEDALGRQQKKGGETERHLAYMSPQQLDGENPNRADDIYSIGVTIHELLTGEVPFSGNDIVPQIRKGAPLSMMEHRGKLNRRGGTILPTWEKAVAACLAKNPAERPQSAAELAAKLGLSGKANVEATAAIAAPAAPVEALLKKNESLVQRSTRKTSHVEKATEKSGPLRRPADPARVEALPGEFKDGPKESALRLSETPTTDASVPDIYPSLYPQRSKFPLTGVAAAVVLAGIGLSAYYFNKQAREAANADSEPSAHISDNQELALVNNADPDRLGLDHIPNAEPVRPVPPDLEQNTSAPTLPEPPFAAEAPVLSAVEAAVAQVPEAMTASNPPTMPRDEVRVAANNSRKGKEIKTAAASPAPALPAGAVSAPESAAVASDPAVVAKREAVEKARRGADAADKMRQEAMRLQQQAEAAHAEAQKALDERKKALAPAMKGAEEIESQRVQREEQAKGAELAAQQARQLAEERSRLAEEAKKAFTEWESQNKPKLAARAKADAELQALQKALADKERTAAEAAAAAVTASNAREQQAAALQQAEQEAEQVRFAAQKAADEAARKMAEAKAAEQAKVAKEMDELEKMRKDLELRMKALQERLQNPNAPTPVPAVAPGGTEGALPTPAIPAGAATTPAASTSAATLAMRTTPAVPSVTPPTDVPTSPVSAETSGTENSLGMKFVAVPGTEAAFCLWPTRLKDFEVFAKETGLKSTAWRAPGFKQGPDHPVVNVSWNDAMAFCKWLTEREKKKNALSGGQSYRLPTDMEWSRAVGLPEEAGNTPEARDMNVPDMFPWGTQWPPPSNAGNYTGEETGSDVAIKGFDDGFTWTSPVGSFPPNKFGLHDMGGNVWQWCMDNKNNSAPAKVLRGASWYNGALKLSLLSSCRGYANPDNSADNYGFRVVLAKAGAGSRTSRR